MVSFVHPGKNGLVSSVHGGEKMWCLLFTLAKIAWCLLGLVSFVLHSINISKEKV